MGPWESEVPGGPSRSQQHKRNDEDRQKTVRDRRAALTNQHFSQQTKGTTHSRKRVSERKGDIGLRSANITGKRKELCVSNTTVFK